MPEIIKINGNKIAKGEDKLLYLNIARLPTYTNIDLPVRVIRAKNDGPVLLLTGGLHGDEINGIEIVKRLLAKNLVTPSAGTVIAIPLVNIYGFILNVRGVPDGKDINRSFPGAKGGSLAKLLAHTLMNEIVSQIDYGIDFHTGGASKANFPQLRCIFDIPENINLAKAFAPPVLVHSTLIEKSFRKAAFKKRKHILVFETGESLRIDEHGVQEGINGTLRLMKYLGMKNEAPEAGPVEIYEKSSWVRARYAGLYQSRIKLGEKVDKGQILGIISDPFGQERFKVRSTSQGQIIGLNNNPVVHKGDAIIHIATNSLK